jgi:hypothetical protein
MRRLTEETMRLAPLLFATLMLVGFVSSALAADAPPADWVEVQAGPMFTVKAPPGTTFERIRTGDAFAGAFHGPGFDLAVEFGYHRDGMKLPADAKNAADTKFVFDEKPGAITKAATADAAHPYFIGLYVPDVEKDAFGPLSLVVTGTVAKSEDQATIERVFQTVKFGYKN